MMPEAAPVTAPPRRVSPGTLWLAALIVLVVVLPFLVSNYHVFQLTHIVIYALAVLGLNLLTGYSGQISLGNGAFYALGAYTAVILINKAGFPYWTTPVVAGAVSFGVGFVFGRPAARLEGLYLALATFGLAIAMPAFLKIDKLEPWTGGAQGIVLSKPTSPIPALLSNDRWLYFFCVAVAVVLYVVAWNLARGRTGRALVALRDHPIAAGTMGIDTASHKSIAFGVSAMYTGVAGALGALAAGFISPESFTILLSIQLLVGGVLGGITSIFGTLFGGAFIVLVPDLTKKFSDAADRLGMPDLAAKIADAPAVLFGFLLIVCMIVMPGGLAGLIRTMQVRLARRSTHRSRI